MAVGSPENGVSAQAAPGGGAGLPPVLILCPYCGQRQEASDQCIACHGLFDPLSRQATQNQMGPWFVRNERNPFAPGMSYERIRQMAQRGRLKRDSVVRGPSTRQFWTLAAKTPGIACLLGECHNCHAGVEPDEYMCRQCGVVLSWTGDRQHLGLAPIKLLPGEAPPAEVASSGMGGAESRPARPAPAAAPPAGAQPKAQGAVAPLERPTRRGRGRRRQHVAQRNALIAVVAFSALVVSLSLIAVFGYGVGVGEPVAPADPPPVAAAPAEQAPEAPPITSHSEWLSVQAQLALLAHRDAIAAALENADSQDRMDVTAAAEALQKVHHDAAAEGVAPDALAELNGLIESLRAKADEIRLRELVDE